MNVIYLDSCTSIYLVEAASPFHAGVVDQLRLASAAAAGASVFLTGDAALARCAEVKVEVL